MRATVLLLTITFGLPVFAANWQLCNNHSTIITPLDEHASRPDDDSIDVAADYVSTPDENSVVLNGNVHVSRKNDDFFADSVTINQTEQSIHATGNLIYQQDSSTIKASSARLQQTGNAGIFNNAELFTAENHSTVQADSIEQYDSNRRSLNNIRYTTCEPDKPYWEMRAKNMQLNKQTGRGLARHMQLRLFDVPFFYLPAFSFPIDDRRLSGFLYPSFGNSDDSGTEITIPWYWNIAPQADATLTARSTSKRGLQLNTEWRLLGKHAKSLFHSENIDDKELNAKRWFYHFEQKATFGNGWNSEIQTYNLADPEHLDDLDSPYQSNDDYLKRIIQFSNTLQKWQIKLLAQDYEFADESANDTDAPFQLLPRLNLSRSWNHTIADIGFSSEFTEFDHATRTDTGSRWVNQLHIEKKFGSAGWFITPKLTAHLTEYDTDNSDRNNRSIPISSIDSGLFFDRYTDTIQQTLEPRLYLVYIPFEDQSNLPNYDTSLSSNSYNQLFQANRFNGNDRIGDAQQASLGLTSRIYNLKDGEEKIRMQIGQRFYFSDREVSIDGSTIDRSEESDIFTGIKWSFLPNWQLNSDIEWQNTQNNTRESRFSLQYRRDNQHLFYLSHSYDSGSLEQADINGRWRIGTRWTVLGKFLYDLENQQNINRFAGIEYENCCLAIRVVKQRLLEDSEQKDSLSLQLSLKGLSTLGKLNNDIAKDINGYQDSFK